MLTPADPCMTFDPINALIWSGVLPAKFDVNRAFLRQLDLLMTSDLCWGCFENANLVGQSPPPPPTFSSKPQSTAERIAVHTYLHTDRLGQFSSIDLFSLPGEKPHKCKTCGRGFKQLTHLTYHMRTHSTVKMYTCAYCGKGFNQKGNLQAHIYGHTGEFSKFAHHIMPPR